MASRRKPTALGGRWANRIQSFAYVAPEDLLAHPLNARRHPGLQRNALRAALDRIGWLAPVIVNEITGRMIDGHERTEEALSEGLDLLPVIYVALTEEEELVALATFDPIGDLALYDGQVWAELHDAIGDVGADLEAALGTIRFGNDSPVDAPEPHGDPDAVPDPPAKPTARTGDVYVLGGRHRLVCGDSSDPAIVDLALDGRLIDAAVMDPPYGVDYGTAVQGRRNMGIGQRPKHDSHVDGDASGVDAAVIWDAVFPVVAARMGKPSALYCWAGGADLSVRMCEALERAGITIHGGIVWVKDRFSFSRSDHKYAHEPAWYGWLTKGTHAWHGPNNETSVWEYPKPHVSEYHPTQKPVDLIRRCVRNITPPEGIVFDPFLGSGTTLIAAHMEGATGIGIEKDPRYVDVICARWEAVFGEKAVRAGGIAPRKASA